MLLVQFGDSGRPGAGAPPPLLSPPRWPEQVCKASICSQSRSQTERCHLIESHYRGTGVRVRLPGGAVVARGPLGLAASAAAPRPAAPRTRGSSASRSFCRQLRPALCLRAARRLLPGPPELLFTRPPPEGGALMQAEQTEAQRLMGLSPNHERRRRQSSARGSPATPHARARLVHTRALRRRAPRALEPRAPRPWPCRARASLPVAPARAWREAPAGAVWVVLWAERGSVRM